MVFQLLFSSGDLGWSIGYNKKPDSTEKNLTLLQYYSYRLAYRPHEKKFNPLLYSGRLTQQLFIHAYVMIESIRMNFFFEKSKTITHRMLSRIIRSCNC